MRADPAETRTIVSWPCARRCCELVTISLRVNKTIITKNKVLPQETKQMIRLAKGTEYQGEEASKISSTETRDLEGFAKGQGVDLFGVADLKLFRPYRGFDTSLLKFPLAISIGIRLSDPILDGITVEDPTPEYASHYKTVNALLDDIALRITNVIQSKGHTALLIPASQITKSDLLQGAISHKAIAAIAGLGWIGKNQLLISPEFGPRLRLASVLTTMPLKAGESLRSRCDECEICVKACPTHAIKSGEIGEEGWIREQVFDQDVCYRRLNRFRDDPRYGVDICGVCVKVCPFGKRSSVR